MKSKLVLLVLTFGLILSISSCKSKDKQDDKNNFTFVFMTDIHLQPELRAPEGFMQAIDTINKINPDFVITGGDLIMDALGQSFGKADSLYNLYGKLVKNLNMPVYNTMGNHEIFGIYKKNNPDISNNPEYGEKMFDNRLGKSYYSFIHKDWKFMIINSVEDTRRGSYIGWVDSTQMTWIRQELAATDPSTPIVVVTHIPFITAFSQKYAGSTFRNDSSLVVANSKEVIDLFKGKNLKLVLQGHLHTVEDIYIDGIHFITGGAVSSAWWNGLNKGFEEGFVKIDVKKDGFYWNYVDYGWNAKN